MEHRDRSTKRKLLMEYFSWRELSTGTTDELNNLLLNNNPHGRTNKGTKRRSY